MSSLFNLIHRKSPSYYIWARDICAVQESYWDDDNQKLLVVQVSVKDEERLPENGSYQKSRTRATVELSAWQAEKVEEGTKVSYIVKVSLASRCLKFLPIAIHRSI